MPHAKPYLQPSSFKRTINCPGWWQLSKDLPRGETSEYAAEGSVAHHLGEKSIINDKSPYDFVGLTGWYNKANHRTGIFRVAGELQNPDAFFLFPVDEAMAAAVDEYVARVREVRASMPSGTFFVEQRADLSWLVPGMFGTADHVAFESLGSLVVDDYKHGAGVVVEVGNGVGDNPQLSIYGLGVLGKSNPKMVEEVTVEIVQPRAPHYQGSVRSVTFDPDDLIQWGYDVVRPAAKAAEQPDAPVKSGEWCKFCPAANALDESGQAICPAKRDERKASAVAMFGTELTSDTTEIIVPPDPGSLSGERLGKFVQFFDLVFDPWAAAVRKEARDRFDNGGDAPPQYKLIRGSLSNRKFAGTDAEVYDALKTKLPKKEVFVEKVKTPAQMEAALKKTGLKAKEAKEIIDPLLAERTEGKPVMVPVDDPRPALPPKVEQMFGNGETDENGEEKRK